MKSTLDAFVKPQFFQALRAGISTSALYGLPVVLYYGSRFCNQCKTHHAVFGLLLRADKACANRNMSLHLLILGLFRELVLVPGHLKRLCETALEKFRLSRSMKTKSIVYMRPLSSEKTIRGRARNRLPAARRLLPGVRPGFPKVHLPDRIRAIFGLRHAVFRAPPPISVLRPPVQGRMFP